MTKFWAFKRNNADTAIVYTATGITFLSIALLFFILSYSALPSLFNAGRDSPFTWVWSPVNQQFGILPMLCNSIVLSMSSMILAFPLALAIGCWIIAIGRGAMLVGVRSLVYFMTAIPTVIYGFIALFLLTPIIRKFLGGSGLCWLSASLMLTILVLPTMILVIVSGLQDRLNQFLSGGLAIGFCRFDLLYFFILPRARNVLLTAGLLGFARSMGDTLLPLMLAGNATQVPLHLSDSLRTLSAHMALVTANEVGGSAYGSLFIACFILLFINVMLSLLAYKVSTRG